MNLLEKLEEARKHMTEIQRKENRAAEDTQILLAYIASVIDGRADVLDVISRTREEHRAHSEGTQGGLVSPYLVPKYRNASETLSLMTSPRSFEACSHCFPPTNYMFTPTVLDQSTMHSSIRVWSRHI
jgi:hypothetical protein